MKKQINAVNNKTGVVFIVVLGVLVLLVLLGVTFSLLSRLDVSSAASYADRIHAKMIAQSGIETAMAKLKANTAQLPQESIYYGEDANKNGKLDADEDQNKNGRLDVGDCPLEYALRPSFAKVDANDKPELAQFKNRKRGSSGELPAVIGGTTDSYALKIIDCNSLIYINGEGKGTERLLNNLGTTLGVSDGNKLGEKIINAREALSTKRFSTKEELKSTLGDDTYQKVTPYLTVYAYVNEKVIKPKPLDERPCRTVEGGKRQLSVGSNVYTWASLNSGKLEVEPRAPININVAPRPILVAALANLEGFYLFEKDVQSESLGPYAPDYAHKDTDGSHSNKYKTDGDPTVDDKLAKMGELKSTTVDLSTAEQIADKILEERSKSPFLSWDDFDKFLDNLKRDGVLLNDGNEEMRLDIIRANANPNTLLNDFNPNMTAWRYVDKSDLTAYTTEFCLQPMGYFEIESQGIISVASPTTSGGSAAPESPRKVLSDYRIKCLVNLWKNEYQTTQKDFADGSISNSQSSTTATHNNKTLQLYPEPDISDYAKKCEADGQIYLATVQSAYQSKQVRFKASFDKDLKANNYRGDPNIIIETVGSTKNGEYDGTSLDRPKAKSLFDETREGPGTLYPDGAYSEWGATPSYDAGRGNFVDYTAETGDQLKQRFRGTVSFWLKRNYSHQSTKPRIIFSATRCHIDYPEDGDWTENLSTFGLFAFPSNYPRWMRHFWTQLDPSNPQQAKDRAEWEGYLKNEEPQGKFVWFWEIDEDPPQPTSPDEYIITHDAVVTTGSTESGLNSRNQWLHITMSWDSDPEIKGTGTFSVRGCTSCGGSGTLSVKCPTCTGSGSVSAGSTESRCGSCGGRGVTSGTRPVICVVCSGSGRSGQPTTTQTTVVCPTCNGARTVTNTTTTEKTEPCPQCNGAKTKQQQQGCPACGGRGRTVTWTRYGPQVRPCGACGGGGKVTVNVPCPGCGGKGTKVTETQSSTTTTQCPGCGGNGSATRTVVTPAPPCDTCKGTGSTGTQQYTGSCGSCGGDGRITTPQSQGCPQCGGDGKQKDSQGKAITTPDSSCGGSGQVKGPEIVEERKSVDTFGLYINGRDYGTHDICTKTKVFPPPVPNKYPNFGSKDPNYIRLGERYGAQIWNYSADSTIDEFTIQQHDDVANLAKEFALTEYQDGRYYKNKGEFTSGAIDVPTTAGQASALRASATWTVYYPAGWDTTQSPVEIQFFDETDNPISEVLKDPKGSEFEIPLTKTKGYATRIKYKVIFQKSAVNDNTPLVESPIFDDINIKFIYPEPMILKWQ